MAPQMVGCQTCGPFVGTQAYIPRDKISSAPKGNTLLTTCKIKRLLKGRAVKIEVLPTLGVETNMGFYVEFYLGLCRV